jgi:hypothetical protein
MEPGALHRPTCTPLSLPPMTTAALESRIRRQLAKAGQRLVKPRSERDRQQLGDAYVVDELNAVAVSNCDLTALAAELGIKA